MAAENGENGESRETKRTTISMSKSELAKLKDYAAESSDYSSFSHFLRAAAEAEMNGGHGDTVQADTSEIEGEIDGLKDGMEELQEQISQLHDLFETIEVRTREPDEDIEELQTELFDELPDEEQTELAAGAEGSDVQIKSLLENEYRYQNDTPTPGWPDDLTQAVGASRRLDVVDALDRMAENMGVVERTEIDGESWFYRRA